MPPERLLTDRHHVIERYEAGASLQQLAQEYDTWPYLVRQLLQAAGISLRSRSHQEVDAAAVVSAYLGGDSVYKLAQDWRVDRSVIGRILDRAAVERRGLSASQQLRFTRPDQHAGALVSLAKAHAAWRGHRHAEESVAKLALTRQRHCTSVSPAEAELREILESRGYQCTPQLAVGRYNLDLAIDRVGIELLGGFWHKSKRHWERTRYLFDAGWSLVFVWVHGRRHPLRVQAADYAVAFIEERRRDPASLGEYRVIRGTGEEVARGRADLNEWPGIPTGDGHLRLRAGHHSAARHA